MRIVAMTMCALTILTCERASADSGLFAQPTHEPYPDIVANSGVVQWDALSVEAVAIQLAYSNSSREPSNSGSFSLNAIIEESGEADLDRNLLDPGTSTVAIKGTMTTDNTSETLLNGELFAFRSSGLEEMEFLNRVTGDDALALFSGIKAVGFVVFGATGFSDNLSGDFDNSTQLFATSDAIASIIPEPGSFLLAVLGVVGFAGGVRLWRNKACRTRKNCLRSLTS